ncbi:hypothetical protein NMG60_11022507 [Bertholletia excelsa]
MATPSIDKKHILNSKLYKSLMDGDRQRVIDLCKQIPEGPLHNLTIHNDTVLHMTIYSKQKELVLDLLRELTEGHAQDMAIKNDLGNTILHEAATSNRIVPAAVEMLRKAPELLTMKNKRGETAIFRAARYGKKEMFDFLNGEGKKVLPREEDTEDEVDVGKKNAYYVREDKTTILHIAVLSEHFELALSIAKEHPHLVNAKDGDNMTALQLLSCNPSAFESGNKTRFIKRLIQSCVNTKGSPRQEEEEKCCRVPIWEEVRKEKQGYESAAELAQYLIEKDTSWEATESAMTTSKLRLHKYGEIQQEKEVAVGEEQKASSGQTSKVKVAETALILATKSGITKIVEGILDLYPQAVEHIDDDGRNILHVAIKYRQMHIFDLVEKMDIPMRRLVRKIDNNGNSILHMVGMKGDQVTEDMRSPALVLQEDLLLFERIEKICLAHFTKHYNKDRLTPEKLFATNNAKIRVDAKEWMKRTAENCSIVAVLIATVAFAAAYTVPGGPNQQTGYPVLSSHPLFVVFTLTDVLSLTFALTSVITFLAILTSPFRLQDFKHSLPQKLMLGVTLLILSVSMMMLAFASTVILMIQNKEQWTRIALCSVAFVPVAIFAVSYLPLYLSLMKTFEHTFKKMVMVFPRCALRRLNCLTWTSNRPLSGLKS